MKRDDLPTVGYLDDCFRSILSHIEAIQRPAASDAAPTVLLTIEQVMAHCLVSRSAVQRWIKNGKKGRGKHLIKLGVLTFGDAEPRIPWPALLAFGRGEAYDLTQLAPPLPATGLPGSPGAAPAFPLRLAS
ncbi:hypothetical protein [Hymenobacter negativus]|uniref:DNA-binding protein n=1 Tax=Hymenobacter negativus TaxID=2795026 RepID=A0ABS3Q8J6_9BACT|nr:hypothetical protein [Hymenobacter negativus]MBO2007579.1 hypothetical protein [Hymenobacter negativus]